MRIATSRGGRPLQAALLLLLVLPVVGVSWASYAFAQQDLADFRAVLFWFLASFILLGWFLVRAVGIISAERGAIGALFEHTPVGLCSLTSDGRILLCNQPMADLFGVADAATLHGKDAETFVRAMPTLGPSLGAALHGEAFAHRGVVRRGRHELSVTVRGVPVRADGQKRIAGILLIAEDVTTRERLAAMEAAYTHDLELQVTARTRELDDLQRQYRTILDHVPDAITILDAGRLVFANRAAATLTGAADPEELLGLGPADFLLPKDDATRRKLAAAAAGTGPVRFQTRVRRRDGERRVFEVTALGMRFTGRRVVLAVGSDVTEREAAAEKERRLNEVRSRFVQIVAHQLRTPLNSIRWNLEMLLRGELGGFKKAQKEFLEMLYEADLTIIRRIGDILLALDIEEGAVRLFRAGTSLEALWAPVHERLAQACEARGIRLRYEPPAEPLAPLSIDPDKIRLALEKLAENAAHYTKEGGQVTARLSATADGVRFEIADTGVGIPAAEQDMVFTRFFRASNATLMKPDASGLGLFVAKRLVELHGGTIGFTSKEGKGSTFWFALPRR